MCISVQVPQKDRGIRFPGVGYGCEPSSGPLEELQVKQSLSHCFSPGDKLFNLLSIHLLQKSEVLCFYSTTHKKVMCKRLNYVEAF